MLWTCFKSLCNVYPRKMITNQWPPAIFQILNLMVFCNSCQWWQMDICISFSQYIIIMTIHWYSPHWGFYTQIPTPGWSLCVTSWMLASTGVAGDLWDEWALPGLTVAPASSLCFSTTVCPFLSPYLSIQCNLTQGAVPLLLSSPRCRSLSPVFSDVIATSEWPAWLELELSWLTEFWHHVLGPTVSASCHPLLPTLWHGCKGKRSTDSELYFAYYGVHWDRSDCFFGSRDNYGGYAGVVEVFLYRG